MCKMVYRVICSIHYTWNLQNSIDQVVDLVQNNDTFRNMVGIINTALFNLFTGTTDEPPLGELTMTEEILAVEPKKTKVKASDLAELNKYKKVAKLPKVTELVDTILEPLCYDNLLQDKNFVEVELPKYEAKAEARAEAKADAAYAS